MNYLLDTHVLLWSLMEPSNLSRAVAEALEDGRNSLYASAVSLWEIAIKTRLGKLRLEGIGLADVPPVLDQLDIELLPMSAEDAIGYASLAEPSHKDPFDRMLVRQAISRDLTLISKDAALSKFVPFGLKLLW